MNKQWLKKSALTLFILLSLTSYTYGQLFSLRSVDPVSLMEGDDKSHTMILNLTLERSGVTLNFKVLYWPQGSSPTDKGELFISNFVVKDGNKSVDMDPVPGRICAILPEAFDAPGVYDISAISADGKDMPIHSITCKSRSWFSEIAEFISITAGGWRSIPDTDPAETAIWITRMPEPGQQIKEDQIQLGIKSATMPAWSPDGSMVACSVWQQQRKIIAVYRFQENNDFREIWRWVSENKGNDFSPVWAPDGRAIAFIRKTQDEKSDVRVLYLDPNGAPQKEKQVTNSGNVLQVVDWDREMGILFESEWNPQGLKKMMQLWTLKISSVTEQNQEKVTPGLVPISDPYMALPGRVPARYSIVYSMEVDSSESDKTISQLYEITKDKKNTCLLEGNWIDQHPRVSSDGKWLTFDSNRRQNIMSKER